MNRETADKLYGDHWCHTTNTVEEANTVIGEAAKAGAYDICIQADSFDELLTVGAALRQAGFDIEPYNGSTDILEISWG